MGESSSEAASRDDAGLISAVASGDAAAYAQLHERHVAAARSLAGLVAPPGQAEEVLSQAFVRLYAALRDGGGPEAALRLYLLTEVRRAAGQDTDEAELAGALLARAFVALPERERATLWHALIEQSDPAQAAAILGVTVGGLDELVAAASSAYIRSYLTLYESGHDRAECREVVRGLDHGADGTLSGLDEFATLPHLRACRECRAAAIELADLGRSLPGWVAPVYLGVAATPKYLASVRVKVDKKASAAGRAAGLAPAGRRRAAKRPRRAGQPPSRSARASRQTSHAPRPSAATAPPSHPAEHAAAPAAPPSRPAEHTAPPTAPLPRPDGHAPRRAGQPRPRGLLRNASRQQRVLAAGGLVVAAFAVTGVALTLASSNGPAPQPAQRPAPAAIAPPSPATTTPSSAPAHRRAHSAARPAPSSSPSPTPRPSPSASPTPSPVASPPPVQDPFPRRHHHHPPP